MKTAIELAKAAIGTDGRATTTQFADELAVFIKELADKLEKINDTNQDTAAEHRGEAGGYDFSVMYEND